MSTRREITKKARLGVLEGVEEGQGCDVERVGRHDRLVESECEAGVEHRKQGEENHTSGPATTATEAWL
jgi:hypothetical protein